MSQASSTPASASAAAAAAVFGALWTCAALAQVPEIGVAYRCDDGNEIRIASCAGSICDLELGPAGRLRPYLRMAPEGAQTFFAAQHCVSPDGQRVAAPKRAAPRTDQPLTTPERPRAPSTVGGIVVRLAALAVAVALLAPLVRRAKRNFGRGAAPASPPAGGAPSYGAPAQAAKPTCNTCSGRGNVACPQCRGRRGEWVGPSGSTQWQSCWSCGGSGEARCGACNGTGTSPY